MIEQRWLRPLLVGSLNCSCSSRSLTKDESKRPKYKELLVSPLVFHLLTRVTSAGDASLASSLPQKDPFIQMYEERPVDVAGYVCRLLDQMPASPSSPTYMD